MLQATLIQASPEFPAYTINFGDYKPAEATTPNAEHLATKVYTFAKVVFSRFLQATTVTASFAGVSFKHVVLGYYGSLRDFRPPAEIYLAVFRVAFWILGIAWCVVTTTGRLVMNHYYPADICSLKAYSSEEINLAHIKTRKLAIDVSHVPPEVKVNQLADIFAEINFKDKNNANYMAPSSLKEGSTTYSVEKLKESLNVFINNVNKRNAFVGTPPQYDTPRLMAFYDQIEKAVRYSLHQVNTDFEKFKNTHGNDVSAYSKIDLQQYKNLFEDRARIAIDLAIAGLHCGGRYMGDSLSIYNSFSGEANSESLGDSLTELLAHERKKIAEGQVQTYLGTNVHSYSEYMGVFGQLLALPGTENVIEHLAWGLDRNLYLNRFFEEYTVDRIIDTVQEKVKSSQHLRDQIIDWLKDQVKEWHNDQAPAPIVAQVHVVLAEVKLENLPQEFLNFQSLLAHLKTAKVSLPSSESNWTDYIHSLLALDESKQWRQATFPKAIEAARVNHGMKSCLAAFSPELAKSIQDWISKDAQLPLDALNAHFLELKTIDAVQAIEEIQTMGLDRETVARIVNKKSNPEEVIANGLRNARRNEFLTHLNLGKMKEEGLPPLLLEWLLVAHGIFLPQADFRSPV